MSLYLAQIDRLAKQWSSLGSGNEPTVDCLKAGEQLVELMESNDQSFISAYTAILFRAMQQPQRDHFVQSISRTIPPKGASAYVIFNRMLSILLKKDLPRITQDAEFTDRIAFLERMRIEVEILKEGNVASATVQDVQKYPREYWIKLALLSTVWRRAVCNAIEETQVSSLDLGIKDKESFVNFVKMFGSSLSYVKIVDGHFLEGDDWYLLQQFEVLQELNLQACSLRDEDLRHFASLQLPILTIWQKEITDEGLAHIKQIPGLQELRLVNCQCTPEGFSQLGPWSGLRFLELTHLPHMRLQDLACLKQFFTLETLEFHHRLRAHRTLVDAELYALTALPQVKTFVLGSATLQKPDMDTLKSLSELRLVNCAIQSQARDSLQGLQHPSVQFIHCKS